MAKQKITIYHLYPDQMNLYGDLGNIIALVKRCEWRGIEAEVLNVYAGNKVDFSKADLIFMGGGQDRGQKIIAEDLVQKGPEIKKEIEKGLVALLICGGFQLFGKYFQTAEGTKIPGIGVFNAYTVASNRRLIGNVVADISHTSTNWQFDQNLPKFESPHMTLVGFENHSGRTILESGCQPLGYVIHGYGNEGDGGAEGGVYKNAYGTYLHGSLLPKNPWFTDHLIMRAIYRRYGNTTGLQQLDDTIEISAHQAAIKRAQSAKTVSI
jgi:CobQ-like glutamine amidotransferase family enzyme